MDNATGRSEQGNGQTGTDANLGDQDELLTARVIFNYLTPAIY